MTWQEKLEEARESAHLRPQRAIELLIEVVEEVAERAGLPHEPDKAVR